MQRDDALQRAETQAVITLMVSGAGGPFCGERQTPTARLRRVQQAALALGRCAVDQGRHWAMRQFIECHVAFTIVSLAASSTHAKS